MDNKNVTASADSGYDDLTEIEGVGPGYAGALKKIGVHSFDDLAQYESADVLRQALSKMAKVDVPLKVIEKEHGELGTWLDQARHLAQEKHVSSPLPAASTLSESEATPGLEKPNSSIQDATEFHNGSEWDISHEFTLFFDKRAGGQDQELWRTRAYYERSGEELEFPGIEPRAWTAWILEQAGLPTTSEALVQNSEGMSSSTSGITAAPGLQAVASAPSDETKLNIVDVELSELGPNSGTPEKQLQVAVQFRLSGDLAKDLVAKRPEYRLEVYTVETETDDLSLVASGRGHLGPQLLEYARRQAFPLPEVGRYQVYCVILLLPPSELVGYQQGPIFNVVQRKSVRVG